MKRICFSENQPYSNQVWISATLSQTKKKMYQIKEITSFKDILQFDYRPVHMLSSFFEEEQKLIIGLLFRIAFRGLSPEAFLLAETHCVLMVLSTSLDRKKNIQNIGIPHYIEHKARKENFINTEEKDKSGFEKHIFLQKCCNKKDFINFNKKKNWMQCQ